jgi:hypothetical protein
LLPRGGSMKIATADEPSYSADASAGGGGPHAGTAHAYAGHHFSLRLAWGHVCFFPGTMGG